MDHAIPVLFDLLGVFQGGGTFSGRLTDCDEDTVRTLISTGKELVPVASNSAFLSCQPCPNHITFAGNG